VCELSELARFLVVVSERFALGCPIVPILGPAVFVLTSNEFPILIVLSLRLVFKPSVLVYFGFSLGLVLVCLGIGYPPNFGFVLAIGIAAVSGRVYVVVVFVWVGFEGRWFWVEVIGLAV
jgi:hypothetical protein